jgi:hypothetical protein
VIEAVGGRYEESSFTEEERCGMVEAFRAIGARDPSANLSVDEAAAEFVLPVTVKSEMHWMLNEERPRPGHFLPDKHGSMLEHLSRIGRSRRAAGRRLSDLQAACLRLSAVIDTMSQRDPGDPTMEMYRRLIERHRMRNPELSVTSLQA